MNAEDLEILRVLTLVEAQRDSIRAERDAAIADIARLSAQRDELRSERNAALSRAAEAERVHMVTLQTAILESARTATAERRAAEAERRAAEAEAVSESRRVALEQVGAERAAEWKRAEAAEADLYIMKGAYETERDSGCVLAERLRAAEADAARLRRANGVLRARLRIAHRLLVKGAMVAWWLSTRHVAQSLRTPGPR